MLNALVPASGNCQLQCAALIARAELPARWFETHPFALVRRGVIVRQRSDGSGSVTSIDMAGTGSLLLLAEEAPPGGSAPTGYAVTEARVCLCPRDALDAALLREGTALDLLRLHRQALARVERIADARSRPSLEGRVAALLAALGDTMFATPRDCIPAGVQQRDLAALLGVRHESVCRALKRLEANGAVRRDADGLHVVALRALVAA